MAKSKRGRKSKNADKPWRDWPSTKASSHKPRWVGGKAVKRACQVKLELDCVPASLKLSRNQVIILLKSLISGRRDGSELSKTTGLSRQSITLIFMRYKNRVAQKHGWVLPHPTIEARKKCKKRWDDAQKTPSWIED